jgi:hypothetical protein
MEALSRFCTKLTCITRDFDFTVEDLRFSHESGAEPFEGAVFGLPIAAALRFLRRPTDRIRAIRLMTLRYNWTAHRHDFWLFHTEVLCRLLDGDGPKEAFSFATRAALSSLTLSGRVHIGGKALIENALSLADDVKVFPHAGDGDGIVGSLIGARDGIAALPAHWKRPLQWEDRLIEFADKLFAAAYVSD